MDLQELGIGTQASTATDQVGTAPTNGGKPPRKKWNINIENRRAWHRREYQLKRAAKIARSQAYYRKHRDRIRLRRKNSVRENLSKIAYRKNNQAKRNAYSKKWISENKDRVAKKRQNYLPRRRELSTIRRLENPNRRLAENIRGRTYSMVKRFTPSKRYKTYDLLGCTPEFFRTFIEAQFTPEMTWANYGTFWNIDHIIPISKFDLQDPVQVHRAFHYSNCQPLDAIKNSMKNDALPGPHQALLI